MTDDVNINNCLEIIGKFCFKINNIQGYKEVINNRSFGEIVVGWLALLLKLILETIGGV